jgi:hypothetical protein
MLAIVVAVLTNNGDAGELLLGASFIYFWAWLVAGAQMLRTWHENRARGQLPPPAGRSKVSGTAGQVMTWSAARPAAMPAPVTCPGTP